MVKKKLKNYFFNCNLKKKCPEIIVQMSPEFMGNNDQYLWIIKPCFLNRGRGISVVSSLTELETHISQHIVGYIQKPLINNNKQQHKQIPIDFIKKNCDRINKSLPAFRVKQQKERRQTTCFNGNEYIRMMPKGPSIIQTDRFLIQKYLQRPMLIKNHKFDIRIWVLITHNLNFYMFKEGYLRLSSVEYNTKQENNVFCHLTNNAIQKYADNYGQISEGNQMSFKELKAQMNEKGLNYQICMNSIREHIKVSLLAVRKQLNPNKRKFSFQIFGYDFMIDQKGSPWLIEVNNNPCLEQSSKMLSSYIPRMLDDAFKLTIDYLFYGSVSKGCFVVEGYDGGNMWENLESS